MAKSMSDPSQMSLPMTCEASRSATSSLASADGLMRCDSLDGPIIEPSGQAVAPVSPSQAPAKATARRTRVTSGPSGSGSSQSAALSSALASRLRAQLNTDGSMVFAMTWKEKVTPSGRRFCRLQASARSMLGSDSGSWPTATVGAAKSARNATANRRRIPPTGVHAGQTLVDAAELASWQTPRGQISGDTAESHEARQARVIAKHGRRMGTPLEVQASWATPTTRDHKDGSSDGTAPINALLGRQAWLSGSTVETAS